MPRAEDADYNNGVQSGLFHDDAKEFLFAGAQKKFARLCEVDFFLYIG